MTQHYSRSRHPVQKIPTKAQLTYAAKRQAMQEADPSYAGHQAGIHPEHRPYSRRELTPVTFDDTGYELEEDESYYVTHPHAIHSNSRRYQVSPEEVYQSGNTRYHVRYVDVPKRKSRQSHLPPVRERYTEEVAAVPKAKRHIHPLLYLGVGMIAMLALVVLVFSGWNWIQTTKDDLTYGRPRTFQVDAVVGHNDSPANPSHFQAINLYRHVEVVEWPGQDSSKMRVFQITTLFGEGEDLTLVTLTFADLLGNGKLDMLIHIHNTTLAYINDNGTFRPAKPGEVKGLFS